MAKEDSIDEIKKLLPEERIKKLKDIEEKNKAEIEKAHKLLKESEEQIEDERKLREKIPIPEVKVFDISQLFTREEKEMFAAQRGQTIREKKTDEIEKPAEKRLEKTLEEEAEKFRLTEEQKQQQKQYIHNLNTIELDKKRENLYNLAKYDGFDNQQQELYRDVQKEFYDRRKAFQEGEYKPTSKRVRELLSIDTSQYIR